jgi:hypothetical protein
MNRGKAISFMLGAVLLFGVPLSQAQDKKNTQPQANKQQQAAKQAQQQQLKADVARYNAQYSNKQLSGTQAAQAQKERQALQQRQKKSQ